MSTFSRIVRGFVVPRESTDRAPAVKTLNVIEMDSYGKSRKRPQQLVLSPASKEQEIAETATALAEFVVSAQMQGFGIDRKTAIQSLHCALEALPIKLD
jgi:hypothetical protein